MNPQPRESNALNRPVIVAPDDRPAWRMGVRPADVLAAMDEEQREDALCWLKDWVDWNTSR